jgi:hypothetical protein
MGAWEDRLSQHEYRPLLETVATTLRSIGGSKLDADALVIHGRITRVVKDIQARLDSADPALVPIGLLERIVTPLRDLQIELEGWVANGEIGWLEDADRQADQLLDVAWSMPRNETRADVEGVQESVRSFRHSAGQLVRNLESDVDAAQGRVRELNDEVASLVDQLDAQKGRVDTAISAFQEQFSAEEARRRTEFAAARDEGATLLRSTGDEGKNALEELVSTSSERITELETSLTTNANERISALDEMKFKAERVLNAIGGLGMAGGFQRTANEDRQSANIWRAVAAGSLLAAIIFNGLLIKFDWLGDDGFSWEDYGQKLLVTIPLLVLAGYAANESRRHREQERSNRAIELQLAALDPYLSLLPEQEQHRLKAVVADRFWRFRADQTPEGGDTAS